MQNIEGLMQPLKRRFGWRRIPRARVAAEDSAARQREAIQAHANRTGYKIVAWYDDPAVSGTHAIEQRPGFAAALGQIAGNGVRTIIVDPPGRD